MTTITFKRSGGVVGDDLDVKLDTDTLPEGESQRMMQLISSANFFNIPETRAPQSTPDEFRYTITVEAGQSSHTVHFTNTTMPESLRPLVGELTMLHMLH